MQVNLAYGKSNLTVELPSDTRIVETKFVPGLPDEAQAIRDALQSPINSLPLTEMVEPGQRVVVVHSDLTRPMPNDRVLPVLLAELEAAGVHRQDITLINGLGTHRPQTRQELVSMLGEGLVAKYHCLQHDCWDQAQLVDLGQTQRGTPILVNQAYMQADVRILTGFIEPHIFAGFSGGPKAVLPSIAGGESILSNHNYEMIGHPKSTWGILDGNLIHAEMLEFALKTEPTFLLNVTINRKREITGVFAGEMQAAHCIGCQICKDSAMAEVPQPYDIVLTSNSGYPLDLNLYQSIKGMSAAAQIVRPGGSIVMAAECWDGVPDGSPYDELLRSADSPQELLMQMQRSDQVALEQWQVQLQAQIQSRADVYVYSSYLSDEQVRAAHFTPVRRIEDTLEMLLQKYGPGASVCVIPEGPLTIPYVSG